MKRIATIVGIVLSVALVVGAFIIGGGDDASKASSGSVSLTKKAAQSITDAGTKVQSAGPSTTDDKKNEGKYETKKVFVSVSPNNVRVGRTFNIHVRGFTPFTEVVVTIAATGYTPTAYEIEVDKQGRGKTKDIAAPTVAGEYSVVAVGPGAPGQPSKIANTTLTVTDKK